MIVCQSAFCVKEAVWIYRLRRNNVTLVVADLCPECAVLMLDADDHHLSRIDDAGRQ